MGAGTCRKRGAIATEYQSVEVRHETPLDRGEYTTGDEEVFQPGEELLGPGLVSSSE